MSGLQFVDELPETSGLRGQTKERATEIKENAPRWAQWPSQTPATSVAKALHKIDPAFEVVGRKCADGKKRAFVRYAPADEPTANGNGHAVPVVAHANGSRQRVKCPTCAAFTTLEEDEPAAAGLARHEATNVVCRSSNRRRR